MTFDKAIQDLADNIAKKATESDNPPPLAERIDALRALTSYYALFLKKKLHTTDEDDETMAGIQDRLRAIEEEPDGGRREPAQNGVSTRRNRRADA